MICDLCLEALEEELGETDKDEVEFMACSLGADIPDHCCEEIETDGAVVCECGCSPTEKASLRKHRG